MREIKFRAWDIDNSKMINFSDNEDYQLVYEQGDLSVCELDVHSDPERIMTPIDKPRDNYYDECILMQYTGLKDKNGKEIYEGDIVRCFSSKRCPHEVIWSEDRWYLSGLLSGYEWGGEEIIGNIYENPELMEKK